MRQAQKKTSKHDLSVRRPLTQAQMEYMSLEAGLAGRGIATDLEMYII